MENEMTVRQRSCSENNVLPNNVVDRLRDKYSNRPLRLGYIGYEPFVSGNGCATGPLVDAIGELANQLGTSLTQQRCTWANFSKRLHKAEIDLVAEPVMFAPGRNVDIIPYCMLQPAHFICRSKYANELRTRATNFENLFLRNNDYRGARLQVHAMSSIGHGFAVSSGTVAEYLLKEFMAFKITSFRNPDLLTAATKACQRDFIFLTAYPTAFDALRSLGGEQYEIVEFLPISIPAGIAVHPMAEDLQVFITCFGGIAHALNRIDRHKLEEKRIVVLRGSELRQILRGNAPINISQTATQEQIVRQRVLGEGAKAGLVIRVPTEGIITAYPLEPRTDVAAILEQHRNQFDLRVLGQLVRQLVTLNDGPGLLSWLESHGEEWLFADRFALAAVLEAAVSLRVRGIEEWVLRILEYSNATPLLALIAAQRVRLLSIANKDMRARIWKVLKEWIDRWLEDPDREEYAVDALPSVGYVADTDGLSWLSGLVLNKPTGVARAAALAILDWAMGMATENDVLGEERLRSVSKVLMIRIEAEDRKASAGDIESSELLATLLWVLGATAVGEQVQECARLVAHYFSSARGTEDAGALRAGALIIRRCRKTALRALGEAFGGIASEPYLNFDEAVHISGH